MSIKGNKKVALGIVFINQSFESGEGHVMMFLSLKLCCNWLRGQTFFYKKGFCKHIFLEGIGKTDFST